MKIKTSELTGAALDWAVAKAEGHPNISDRHPDGGVRIISGQRFHPSGSWSDGGPIIERESIAVFSVSKRPFEGEWAADIHHQQQKGEIDDMGGTGYSFYADSLSRGPTPLVAAMRCFVASKLGDEVEIPVGLA